jgi:hypothetical protein
MSNSTGSRPTTSSAVPHSSQDTVSPLSVSISTWTSASHSGHVPVGTFSTSRANYVRQWLTQTGEVLHLGYDWLAQSNPRLLDFATLFFLFPSAQEFNLTVAIHSRASSGKGKASRG